MANTFDGIHKKFANTSIHFIVAEAVTFRKQLAPHGAFCKTQSGWDDAWNEWLKGNLEKLSDTLERVTYNPSTQTKTEIEEEAASTETSLAALYSSTSIRADDIPMPSGEDRELPFDFSGADPDLPQVTPQNCPNDHARAFIAGLDNFIREITKLDARHQDHSIPKFQSAQMRRLLGELYTICMVKGGEDKRFDVVTGTLPSQKQAGN